MESSNYNIAIIGGGLAGLSAAIKAEESGHRTILIEAASSLGGRVKSDHVDGYTLDHGFQVLLSEYEKASEIFDMEGLQLGKFEPGAIIIDDEGSFKIGDPRRNLSLALPSLFSRAGTLGDKLKILKLSKELQNKDQSELFEQNGTTMEFLQNYGFSDKVISKFFRPFFAGIFLEPDLKTPSSMFKFVFDCFAKGHACLPAKGMQALPDQLASRLKQTEILLGTKVEKLDQSPELSLSNGQTIKAKKVILACDPGLLIPQMDRALAYKGTITMYFSSSDKETKLNGLIALDSRQNSPLNNVARIDEVCSEYAPAGKALWSVTLRSGADDDPDKIRGALASMLKAKPENFYFLKAYRIPLALPKIPAPALDIPAEQTQISAHVHLAGDYLLNSSIDGALRSGYRAAEAVTETLDLV